MARRAATDPVALRQLRAHPPAVVAVMTLALGIGANSDLRARRRDVLPAAAVPQPQTAWS
jgi:hypothetical protein